MVLLPIMGYQLMLPTGLVDKAIHHHTWIEQFLFGEYCGPVVMVHAFATHTTRSIF